MKIFKRILEKRKNNEKGMTLVEVIVATTIFGILAGMICTAANYSMRQQAETEQWNDQTDRQTSYLSQNRNDAKTDASQFTGGDTPYKLVMTDDKGVNHDITTTGIGIYRMDTIYHQNSDGDNLPTFEDANIFFFRVDNP